MSIFWGEVIGTAILLFLGGGACAASSLRKSFGYNSGWLAIQFAWGLAVAVAIYAVGNISGAHLNPAVTLAFALIGKLPWGQLPVYIAAQFLGAMIGASAVFLQYHPHWKETADSTAKLGVFVTSPAIPHTFANLVSEILATFTLLVGLLAIGANTFTAGLNPLIVGFLIMLLGLSLGGTTGTAMNPARDLGPRIMHFLLPIPGKGESNWKYAWIPVVGPVIGGSLGALFYEAVFLGKLIPLFLGGLGFTILILIVVHQTTKKIYSERSIKQKAA